MPETTGSKHRHFILEDVTKREPFRSPQSGGGDGKVRPLNRSQHGGELLAQLRSVADAADRIHQAQEEAGYDEGFGLRVEFTSFPNIELAFESLAREAYGIELLNVRHGKTQTYATVWVPKGELAHFEKLIRDYLAKKKDSAGRPRDNQRLIDAIRAIRAATLRALWTDDASAFPKESDEQIWWEVWLSTGADRKTSTASFLERAQAQGLIIGRGELEFPERTVVVVRASADQMRRSMMTLNSIAELRRAKDTAEFFDGLTSEEQNEWLDDLLQRATFAESSDEVPRVCILDTGASRGHPLLTPAMDADDLHTIEPAWGTHDDHGHGTQMAGLALIGDLKEHLSDSANVGIDHRLESVKLLPFDGANAGDSKHHGSLTTEAVSRPEISYPERARVFSMAITAKDDRDRGRPSAWSAALDRIAFDADAAGESPRLFVVSGGNVSDPRAWANYPTSNDSDGIHDPGQSWNALTVGAYTNLAEITETDAEHYRPIASAGGLSPFSTTSLVWQREWPLKPDIILEGGNAAEDGTGAVWMPSLSVLTTYHRPFERLFTTSNATSAATALAARMAAQIMTRYRHLWPETVRGLLVHSAEWTECMKSTFLPRSKIRKADYERLVRRCGFGVPDLDRALWSVENSLTMVIQQTLQPYQSRAGKTPALRDMHLHRLPWPKDVLESLGETEVSMRVTLSYFVEPNPSARGRSRYRYESHGLRFAVKRPGESINQFRARINAEARDVEEGTKVDQNDPAWLIGSQGRHRGSIHSDIWRGMAADLASRGVLAVYPTLGWWKTRPNLDRVDRAVRYALIVSISAPEVDVDLYSEIANQIGIEVGV